MGRVVAAYAYRDGRRVAEIQLGESACWAREKGEFVWIGFREPTEQDLRTLQAQFGLHELAVEDALHAHQVPKLEVYGQSLFVVLRTAALERGKVVFGETHLFVGEDYIISVRHGASQSYARVRQRCEASPQ
ncbi:MAG TPA: CorA family divalent cation transporter, partial [Geminicoccaceae bacterium]|nr:CorA family divalent cation transporter [Geminicoccaceae bacterium]